MDSRRKQVSVALEVATKELGYKELRPNQDPAVILVLLKQDFYERANMFGGRTE